MGDLKLYYFPFRARAEPIRMSLAVGGIKYEDNRVPPQEWPAKKKEAPFGQMPYIEYKGVKYGESKAIASFVAKLAGLAGKSPQDAMRVDEVYSLFSTLLEEMAKANFEKDEAKQKEMKTKVGTETIPRFLGYFETMLKETGDGYFVAGELSQADLTVFDITHTLLKQHSNALDHCPHIKKMRENVAGHPKVKAYLASRSDPDF